MKVHNHLVISSAQIIQDIFSPEQIYADKRLEKAFKLNKKWGKRDRSFVAEIVYNTVRWWRLGWELIRSEISNDQKKIILVMGAIDRIKGEKRESSLWEELDDKSIESRFNNLKKSAIKYSIPDWLFDVGQRELESSWEKCLDRLNQPAPIVLRANTIKCSVEELKNILKSEGVETHLVKDFPYALKLKVRKNVFATKAFKEGLFEMQDGSSQLVAPFLSPEQGERVIDACAGAGGKTLHIASLMNNKGKIIALDLIDWKLKELKKRASRNGISNIEVKVIESSKTIKRLKDSADRVLLDVPCSGLGVLKRNPDTKWKLSLERLKELQEIQRDIISRYSKMVKINGVLVYSTCSILPSENDHQIKWFLKNEPGWKLEEEKNILPKDTEFDGFYMARLKRIN